MTDATMIQQVWSRQQIEQLIYRLTRSFDRMDAELMKSCYWRDATDEHSDPLYPDQFNWNGNAWEYVPEAMRGFAKLKASQHRVSNILIEVNGDQASAEGYVWAYHVSVEDGAEQEGILFGRYLFQFSRRDGEWRIQHRATVFDGNQNGNGTARWSDEFPARLAGKHGREDLSYQFIESQELRN